MSTYPIDVSVNPTGAVDGSRRVKQELRGMDRLAKSLLKTFAGLFAGAAVAQGVRAGVRLLRDYEQEMSTLQAITGATEMQFASMRDTAKELGITTRFSAQEAAAGMTFLARAGFDARQATEAIGPTLLLAQAGGLGLASAADIASNVLKGFRLEVDQTNRVVDILAKASNSANTNVSQLGQALSFVAPVASGLGIELEQTVAAIGVLSDAGIQGSRAGTGLSRVLAELESPSENTRKIFAALGVDISAVKPSVVGLSGALEALTTAGIDTGTALEVFGQRGGPAFEVLASSIDDIQTLDEKLQNAGGSAERMAAIMDDNLNGAALAFRSAVQGLVIELGDAGLTDALKGLVAVLTEIVRFFADNAGTIVTALQLMAAATIAYHSANFIMTTFVKNQTIISMINLEKALGAATTRQALMGVASKSLARGLGLATGATKGLTVAMLANPIGAIAAGIAALVILFVKFGDRVTLGGDRLANLHDLAIATFQIIKESLSGLVSFFGDALTSMTRFFGDNFGFIGEFAQKVFGDVNLSVEGVLRFGAKAVDNFQGLWVGLFEAIKEVFSNFGPVIKGVFISALNGAVAIVEAGINKMVLAMNKLLGAVKAPLIPFADLGRIANENSDAVKNVGQAFLDGFNGVSLVEDQLDRILLRAEEIATKRISGQASGDPINVPSPANDNQGGPSRNAADLALAKERQAIIDQTVTSLDQEAAALRLLGDEREIYQRQLQIENEIADKLRNSDIDLTEEQIQKLSQLTDAEKTLITEKQRRNIALERQAAILDSIDAPLVNYQNAVTALNQLMAQGLITADAYNAAIAGTQLVQDLQGVDSALGGDFAQNAELERVRAQEAERLEIIRQAQEAGLLNQEQYEERYTAIVNNGARARMDIQLAEAERNASAVKGGLDNILGAVETFAGKQNGLYKGILAARRAFATAEVIINTTRAVQSALAEYPFPINVGVAAGQAALGASNIAKINGVGFADGGIPMPGPGLLGGTGGPREDSNIIRVSRGEGILNAAAVRKNLGLFNALNEDPDFLKNIGLFRDGGVPISSTGQRASLNRRTISASDRDLISISFINNGAPQTYEVDFVSRDEIKIIANDIRKDVPGIVSGQIENPNSQISRSLKESTNAGRRV